MVTTSARPPERAVKPQPPAGQVSELPRPRLRLSAVGEYLRGIADKHTAGAVQVDARRHHGSPVLDDTRIPVSSVLRELAAGKSWAQITRENPDVTEERIRAALRFATAVLWHPQAEDVV